MHAREPTDRPALRLFAWASLPWWWFAVRDAGVAADVVAILLPLLVAVAVAALVLRALRRRRALAVAGSWVLFGAVAVAGPWTPVPYAAPARPVRIVAANVLWDNDRASAAADDVAAQRGDVVVVSEGAPVRADLRGRYRHALFAPGGTAVYTDLPVTALPVPPGLEAARGVRARIEAPGGPFVLWAVHLPRPSLRTPGPGRTGMRRQVRVQRALAAAIGRESLPVVLAGDLNTGDRTRGYRWFTGELRDAMRAGWTGPTFRGLRPLLLRIDHVLASPSWCAADPRRFAISGSDHLGVAVDVGPCRG